MENELNELISAWRVCQDASPKLDPKLRMNAFNFIESFKNSSPHTLDIGFYLSNDPNDAQQPELIHFGHQLVMHSIKTKWNEMNPALKSDIKTKILEMLAQWDSRVAKRSRPMYLNNSICLLLIELIKREWPQNWPTLLNDLVELSLRSLELKKLVFIVLKYIAEEFIDVEAGCATQLPAQRRKDINQYLSSNMETLFGFYLDCLESCCNLINSADNQFDQIVDLTNSCLDSLSYYMNWLNINLILSRNYSLVNILLGLLSDQKLCVNSAKCLVGLANRKGSNSERIPLLGLFSESVMQLLLNCTKLSLESGQHKDLMKHLVQILVGMGGQLNHLWQSNNFEQKPNELRLYLKSIYELLHSPNGLFSYESITLLNSLLQNEFICQDADFQQLVSTLSEISPDSYLLTKFSYASMRECFDDETEYSRFAQRYRSELAKMIRLAANLNPNAFFKSGFEWALKVITETQKLPPNDLTGYDPASFLYVYWDSLVYLWNNIIQVFSKNTQKLEMAEYKPKLVSLVSYSVQIKSHNANFVSFCVSFINSILNQACDLCDSSSDREVILKTVLEKLFHDFELFKAETSHSNTTPTIRNKIFNVRRQICATILNVFKLRSQDLVPFLDPIFTRIMEIVRQTESTTQMERSILIQALFFCSNESKSYDLQLSLVKQFLTPVFEFFEANKDAFSNVDAFIQFIGIDDPVNCAQGINNRKQIFFCVNCLFGILKSINFLPQPPNVHESTYHLFIAIFSQLLDLLKSFNLLHSSSKVNREYLAMTETIKSGVLVGAHQEKHAQNDQTAIEQQSERLLMFVCHTYETLNQLISVYLVKLKDKLLLVELNQEFIFKFGESVLSALSDLPPFRIRSIIKYVLKTCLTVVNFDRDTIQKNLLICKLNQVVFEYFLPSVLAKINNLNDFYKNLSLTQGEQTHDVANNQQLQTQIAEENQFVLMCRDFVDLIRVFFTLNNQATTSSSAGNDDEQGIDDENEVVMENRPKEALNQNQISELALSLLQSNKVIYQTIILLISDGLNWPDSLCCHRLAQIALGLFEKFPVTATESSNMFTLHMNPQIAQQLFTCCLTSLQIHGEHQETASQLTSLALLIYDRSPNEYRQNVYYRVLDQIPDVNKRMLDEFTIKSALIDATSPKKTTANMTNQERLRKDMFKKLISPVVGKSLGQLYKQEIRIRVLEPLDIKTKRKINAEREDSLKIAAEVNICSLFDPTNN